MCKSPRVPHEQLASELVRAVRGKRSQLALSRRLGFSTNVLYAWESGRNFPTAAEFLRLAEQCRIPVRRMLASFYVTPPAWLGSAKTLPWPRVVAAFLQDQRGRTPIIELAAAAGISRFALSRWLKGTTEPRLPDFLWLIEHSTQRLGDWLALFTDPAQLPSFSEHWLRQQAARRAAHEMPWTQPVLRALELEAYRALDRHESGWIARRLGIPEATERQALETLSLSGQIALRGGRWCVEDSSALNLRTDPEAAERQREFWARVAAERVNRARGMFAYNICAVSARDLGRLKALEREFLQQARSIIAQSAPVEHVALLQVQIFSLDEFHEPSARESPDTPDTPED
jgi:transcriptional regulator with XRE-family HTH domain